MLMTVDAGAVFLKLLSSVMNISKYYLIVFWSCTQFVIIEVKDTFIQRNQRFGQGNTRVLLHNY
jgi:hypothetical protein